MTAYVPLRLGGERRGGRARPALSLRCGWSRRAILGRQRRCAIGMAGWSHERLPERSPTSPSSWTRIQPSRTLWTIAGSTMCSTRATRRRSVSRTLIRDGSTRRWTSGCRGGARARPVRASPTTEDYRRRRRGRRRAGGPAGRPQRGHRDRTSTRIWSATTSASTARRPAPRRPRCTSSRTTDSDPTVRGAEPDAPLYPPIEPYARGLLDVGDGQQIYWEECGNPAGKPAVFLHGGPGGGCIPRCGGCSTRRATGSCSSTSAAAAAAGRTPANRRRSVGATPPGTWSPTSSGSARHRGIERWQVFGGSWGSALALAYAETHPERVTELVLRGIFTLRRSELDFYYNGGAGQLFPERYELFLAPLGGRSFAGDTIAAYHDLLFDPDPAVHGPAGVAWSTWEAATITLEPDEELIADFSEPDVRAGFRPDREPLLHPRRLVRRGPADRRRAAGWPTFPGSSSRAATTSPPLPSPPRTCIGPGRRPNFRIVPVGRPRVLRAGHPAELLAPTDRLRARLSLTAGSVNVAWGSSSVLDLG